MCDTEYDGGGYEDRDYYDLEFRQQNPDIYGNDEYMQVFYGNNLSVSNLINFKNGCITWLTERCKFTADELEQFANKHIDFFKNKYDSSSETFYRFFEDNEFARDCETLRFEMDCGHSFTEAYGFPQEKEYRI